MGILLQWLPPAVDSPPITAVVLQARREKGEWLTLYDTIAVNMTELIVQGLVKVKKKPLENIEKMPAWFERVVMFCFLFGGLQL